MATKVRENVYEPQSAKTTLRGFVIFSRKRSICDVQRFFDRAANSATISS